MNKLPSNLRAFDDVDATRKNIYDDAINAVTSRFPVEDDDFRLELHDVAYDGPQKFTLEQQKHALIRDRKLQTPMIGTWRLIDKKTNAVLDERPDVVMHVPYYTPRGTIIHRGNEYSVINQARLKPGAYVRKKKSGEIETHFNVEPGSGVGFRVFLEPSTGVFKMQLGQSQTPIYPLLRAIGVTDQQMIKAWGPELTAKNAEVKDNKTVERIYQRLAGSKAVPNATPAIQAAYLMEALPKFKVDPEVMAATMGLENVQGITPEALVRATQKMLNVSKGSEESDDRDAPRYSNYYSVEDLIRERIDKDAGKLTRNLLFKMRRSRNLKPVARGALNPYIDSLIVGSGLAQPLEETNPLHTLEQMTRIIKTGEGGIGSTEAITDEARNVNPGQFGFIDPVHGPERMSVGIDVRTSHGTYKGRDKQIYAEFLNPQTGKTEYLNPQQMIGKTIAFPGEMAKDEPEVSAMVNGKLERVPRNQVDYVVPSFGHMLSAQGNLNPMPTGLQPGRLFYSTKFWSQYMPQVQGEVPLVDSLMDDGETTYSEYYGRKLGTIAAKAEGVVKKVGDDGITVVGKDGEEEFYETIKDFPFNRMTGISFYPTVKPGDKIKAGQMIAHSNFTDKQTGAINMGQNLKTAIIPARGMSYEDAYVISETAAKKLANQRIYGYDQEARHGVEVSRDKYISLFPNEFSKEQIEKIGDDGIIKPGAVVNYGDPLILATGPKLLSSTEAQLGSLHKVLRNAFTNKATVWEYEHPGVVTDVAMTSGGAKVNVRSEAPVGVGDKLTTRYGLKGVVGSIIPDDKMPRDPATNEPYQLLLNPMGVLSRVAPAQIVELALAKLAKKTGKPVRIPQLPPPEGWAAWATKQLADAGIDPTSPVFDPETGKTLKPVGDGFVYVSAFHHLAEKKLSSRGGTGTGGYTADMQPARGGSTGSKKFSNMDVNAALAHGATEVIKDVITIRGNKDEEFWKALKLGRPLPRPQVPFIYNKFLNLLRAGGANVREEGDIVSLLPMTDDDVTSLSKGEVKTADMVDNNFEPIPNGLFDAGTTGGMNGNRWTHLNLVEPIPNPVMEEPIRRLLGLTKKQLHEVIGGTRQLGDKTGGAAIKEALGKIDIDAMIEDQKQQVKSLRGTNRDNAVKIVGYLAAAKKEGIHPSKWVLSKVPILPPIFRPVSRMGDLALIADLNEMYRDMIETNNSIGTLRKDVTDADMVSEKLQLYKSVAAAFGLTDAITQEGQAKNLKGAIRQVIGDNPKFGLFQSKVISKPVDVVGRGVVTPDPNLDMDSIGIPEDSAWTLYKDFVMRSLVRRGYPPLRAVELIENRSPEATKALHEEMADRPVVVNRAPTWHKFNLLAFYPHIAPGNTIRVSPLITKGFTMDFDGDQANFHVPVDDKAVQQTKDKMLPSRNLFSLTDLKSIRHSPTQELSLGLYMLTQAKSNKPPVKFSTLAAAKAAYAAGTLGINDPIEIG